MKSSPQPSKIPVFIGYTKSPVRLGPLRTANFEVPIAGLVHDKPFLTTAYISVGSRLKIFIDPVAAAMLAKKKKSTRRRGKKTR